MMFWQKLARFTRCFSVLAMLSTLPASLHAQDPDIPEGYASFESYEIAMFARIDALAAQRGVNISFLHEDRAELHAEYESAKQRNDKTGMTEARAMQAYIIRYALEKLSQ